MQDKRYSVGFSEFRNLMDLWDNFVFKESIEHEIDKFLTHKQIIMFFMFPVKGSGKNKKITKKSKLYGATEDNRLAFAQIKHPNPDDLEKEKESFQAFDLDSLVAKSDEPEDLQRIKIFNKQDVKKIKIVSQEYAIERLSDKKAAKHLKPIDSPEKQNPMIDDE
jgi:hypothetical protein